MGENRVVPRALDDTSYDIWSNCVKIYLLSQDLWDVIEPEVETEAEESSEKNERRKNALALHAIHMSCGSAALSKIGKLDSAKEAWDLLKSSDQRLHHDPDTNVVGDDDDSSDGQGESSSNDEEVEEQLDTMVEEQSSQTKDDIDYEPFWEATKQGDWKVMKEFIDSHPEAIATEAGSSRTALHYVLNLGDVKIGRLLVDETKRDEDFEIQDSNTYTAFSLLSHHNHPGVLKLLQHMVSRNNNLPNIGNHYTTPVIKASWKGFKDTTRYLYSVTDEKVLNPDSGNNVGVKLLVNCINIRLFDIASEIVRKFPKVLLQQSNDEINPIYALAKLFSALKNGSRHKKPRLSELIHWLSKPRENSEHLQPIPGEEVSDGENLVYNNARAFLLLVCAQVSRFSVAMLKDFVYDAMIEASKNGDIEFITEMLIANSNLIEARVKSKTMFWHAIANRQEKVYNLIYSFIGQKDALFSCPNRERNNIVHLVAELAPPAALDRTSGPALQMQKDLQWFQEVWSLAKIRYREDLNNEDLTPRALFTKAHAKLIDDGEKAMKDTAQSSTVVGALIATIMFAAAFTVPGGNNQDSGLPVFLRKTLFRIFIVCDALSLYTSTTSVLVFLGILTSRYAEEDFSIRLPRKLMMGLTALFFSITTMMISFCTALALMLDGNLRYVLPTVLLASLPIIIFMSSIVPVLWEMFMSTFGPSMFDKTGKVLEKKEDKKVIVTLSADNTKKLPIKEEDREKANDSGVKKSTNIKEENRCIMNNYSSSVDKNMSNQIEEASIINPSSVYNKRDKNIVLYNPSRADEIV